MSGAGAAGHSEPGHKPAAILLSKRAAVVYLEHARVLQKGGRVLYLTDRPDAKLEAARQDIDEDDIDVAPGSNEKRFFNIPYRNTAVLMLGKGTSITDSAARLLAESGVLVAFTGSGGSPLFSGVDQALLSPQGEYRPTEYMQSWMRMWLDDAKRLQLAKRMLRTRLDLAEQHWALNKDLGARKIYLAEAHVDRFSRMIKAGTSTGELLSAEGDWVKGLYRFVAEGYRMSDFQREERPARRSKVVDAANAMLTHGNYIAYGYAAATLYTMGISFALPVLHGKTRRGGLVFDVADLVKDWTVLPAAFKHAFSGDKDQAFRNALIDDMQQASVLDVMFDTIKKLASE